MLMKLIISMCPALRYADDQRNYEVIKKKRGCRNSPLTLFKFIYAKFFIKVLVEVPDISVVLADSTIR